MAANQERDVCGRAAALLVAARSGTLATVNGSRPHAALVTPAVAADGSVILLLSDISAHTRNLRVDPAAALLVAGAPADANPQTAARLLLAGELQVTEAPEAPEARTAYLKAHPYADLYYGFGDFNFWRLIVKDAHYIGGFAAATVLNIAALQHEINRLVAAGSG